MKGKEMTKTVNDYVLEMMEKLSDDSLKGEDLKDALAKSEQITKLARTAIESEEIKIKDKEVNNRTEELEVKKMLINAQFNGGNGQDVPLLTGAAND
jgi:hypothetical protein